MASIDRADWHYGADNFPKDLPEENGATHIGMVVRWAISKGFFVDDATEEEEIEAVRTGKVTARDFVMDALDGKLWDSMLTEECAAFAKAHWSDYLDDFAGLPLEGDSVYHIEDTDENYAIMAAALDDRWADYLKRSPQVPER